MLGADITLGLVFRDSLLGSIEVCRQFHGLIVDKIII